MNTATLQHKAFNTDITISPDEPRTIVVRASTAAVDRDGEVLIPMGCNSKDWERNPCITLQHSYYNLPVARGTGIKRTEDSVDIKLQFAERPKNHPEGQEWVPDTLFSLYSQRVMNGVSVGFLPNEGRAPKTRDIERFGEGCTYIHSKWGLLELALVTIGCNPEAVTLAVSKGFVTQATADKLFKPETPVEPVETPEKPAEIVAKEAPDDEKPAMGTCSKCEKEYPIDDMDAVGDDAGTYICDACAMPDDDEVAKTAEELADIATKTTELLETVLDSVEKQLEPESRQVVAMVDAPVEAPAFKRIHAMFEPPPPPGSKSVGAVVAEVIPRRIAKARGIIYLQQ